ncbi:hypothetical protein LFT44_15670 [Arthrobacter sp. FW306-05-C]|uniref:hypothetical protein n=1 Tax=Arthrobacter sp. FW306-05-C TaxID=2879620 RepID=UPI001F44C9DF|nr:hypothetical protein [Arthrobacter sp. FW306-05-C]UKA65927.1 hypothetical protein LFT44_15670 [Arthrobacter sp. FW306-05-C]
MLSPFVTVPVSLQYLGASLYGAWAAALSLTAVAVFADLGIGAGLMTRLAKAMAEDDTSRARRLISTAYLALSLAVVICLISLWVSSLSVDWAAVVGRSSSANDPEVESLTLLTLSAFILNIVGSLIIRVQYAMQQVGRSNMWQGAASVIGIAAVLVAARVAAGSEFFIALASFSPVCVSLVNTILFFTGRHGRSISPRLSQFSWNDLKDLAAIGARFLLITVLMAATLSSDNWIIAQTVSLSEVTNFAIPARIFAMFGVITAILTTPLWPLNAAALQNGDTAWVRAITRKMVIITSLSVGGLAGIGILLGKQAIGWWLGSAIVPSSTLLCGLGLMVFVQAVVAPLFMVQNGGGVLMAQTVGYSLFLIVVPLKWFIATHIGTMWIPFAGATLYCVLVWPAAFIGYRQTLLRASKDHPRQMVETQ